MIVCADGVEIGDVVGQRLVDAAFERGDCRSPASSSSLKAVAQPIPLRRFRALLLTVAQIQKRRAKRLAVALAPRLLDMIVR